MQPMGFHVRLGWSGWFMLLVTIGVVLAIAAVVTVVLLGVFVILLPVALIAGLLFYLFPNLRQRPAGGQTRTDIIEGEYRIVDPRQLDRDTEPRDRP